MSCVKTYKLVAVPFLLVEGTNAGHLETVTFFATNNDESHKWWTVNTGTFVADFSMIVSPELASHFVSKLRAGETVEFPNRYELAEIEGQLGGSWKD
jgi:hypothetical protein